MSDNNMPDGAISIFALIEGTDEFEEEPVRPLIMKSGEVVFATMENLRTIVEQKCPLCLVWPGEGEFDHKGKFHFNDKHADFEPIMIPCEAAGAMVLVRDAVTEGEQEIFDRMVAGNRAKFWKIFKFSESHTTYSFHHKSVT